MASSRYRSRRVRGPRQGTTSDDGDDGSGSSSSSDSCSDALMVADGHEAPAVSSSGSDLAGPISGSTSQQQPDAMRVLVLAHRHELLVQAHDKFRLMWGGDVSVSYVKGARKEFWGQVRQPAGSVVVVVVGGGEDSASS